jgi:S-adenosylmethionine synthetase
VEIGYDRAKYGFDGHSCAVLVSVDEQSPDIAQGVNREVDEDQGAGDQGMMFGYACDETEEYMPLAISLAHKLTFRLSEVRKNGALPYLRPDGKAQVTVEYDNDTPVRLEAVVLSTQHAPEVTQEQIYADIMEHVFKPVLPAEMLDENTVQVLDPGMYAGKFDSAHRKCVTVVHCTQGDVLEVDISVVHEDCATRSPRYYIVTRK